jgi:TRAP-type C4-dicarboxylate transport system permease small subunit
VIDLITLRAEHDATLSQLSQRKSTLHFAHTAVSLFLAAIMCGAAIKLAIDVELEWAPHLVLPVSIVSVLAAIYGVGRLLVGLRKLGTEVQGFERLKALRHELKLDEPPSLPTAR